MCKWMHDFFCLVPVIGTSEFGCGLIIDVNPKCLLITEVQSCKNIKLIILIYTDKLVESKQLLSEVSHEKRLLRLGNGSASKTLKKNFNTICENCLSTGY